MFLEKNRVNYYPSLPATKTLYLDGFQYENDQLKFFPQPEGYVKLNAENTTFAYVFNYTDHLGNVRLAYQDKNSDGVIAQTEILEENNYYPFGLKHRGYNDYPKESANTNKYKYQYNGKELQTELELNWNDYGARNYDPAIGRFFGMDRLSEKYETLSPYSYVAGNPIKFIDVNGEWIYISGEDEHEYRIENGQTQVWSPQDRAYVNINDTNIKMSSDVIEAVTAIRKLAQSGATGSELVDYFNNDKNNVLLNNFLSNKSGVAYEKTRDGTHQVYLNSSQASTIATGLGSSKEYSPFYTIVGHELAHVRSDQIGNVGRDALWFGDSLFGTSSIDEINATHVENKIRAEAGLPLRTFYGPEAILNRNAKTKKMDGTSRYIQLNQTYPTIQTVNAVMNGEILENRYDYRLHGAISNIKKINNRPQ